MAAQDCTIPKWAEGSAKPIYLMLQDLKIKFDVHEHLEVKTVTDMTKIFPKEDTVILKNLFVTDKKQNYYLVSTISKKPINMNVLDSKLQASQCRLASAQVLKTLLKVETGAVSPFAMVNDPDQKVKVVFDESIKKLHDKQKLLVHPLINTATLGISCIDLIKIVDYLKHKIEWVSFGEDADKTREPSLEETTTTKTAPQNTDTLGVTAKKEENFSEWYTQVIVRSEMIDYYDVSGCYVLRPWSFFMWECAQEFMDKLLKKTGVKNAYFPLFVSKNRLETEKAHVEGFSPEVAWVTRYGDSELAEPIAIRPTSETIIYPSYAKWIRSHRDLPFKLNQWCQVVRWEFKQPTPFIRTREFLWQEGHTAHATDEDAEKQALEILQIYKKTYEDIFAVPVIQGLKSENEKFAGGKTTMTLETVIIENGRACQAGTSHHLGTNFSKMFGIEYEDRQGKKQLVHQTSWGYTTRSIGICVMVHGDNKGMVMPPHAAPIQVIGIPITYKDEEADNPIVKQCQSLIDSLNDENIRCSLDDRDNYTPGWKYNDWEKKGVCIRLELGPRDMANKTCRLVRRDTNEKKDVSWSDLIRTVKALLEEIHSSMLKTAWERIGKSIVQLTEWKDVVSAVNDKKLVLVPWCEDMSTEEEIKQATKQTDADEESGVLTGPIKSICKPFKQPELAPDTKCFFTNKPAKGWWYFGRSY